MRRAFSFGIATTLAVGLMVSAEPAEASGYATGHACIATYGLNTQYFWHEPWYGAENKGDSQLQVVCPVTTNHYISSVQWRIKVTNNTNGQVACQSWSLDSNNGNLIYSTGFQSSSTGIINPPAGPDMLTSYVHLSMCDLPQKAGTWGLAAVNYLQVY